MDICLYIYISGQILATSHGSLTLKGSFFFKGNFLFVRSHFGSRPKMSAHIGEASPLSLLGPLISVYGRDDLVDVTIVCPGPLRLTAKHPDAAALIMKRILIDSRFYAVVGYPKADTHLGWGPMPNSWRCGLQWQGSLGQPRWSLRHRRRSQNSGLLRHAS